MRRGRHRGNFAEAGDGSLRDVTILAYVISHDSTVKAFVRFGACLALEQYNGGFRLLWMGKIVLDKRIIDIKLAAGGSVQ